MVSWPQNFRRLNRFVKIASFNNFALIEVVQMLTVKVRWKIRQLRRGLWANWQRLKTTSQWSGVSTTATWLHLIVMATFNSNIL